MPRSRHSEDPLRLDALLVTEPGGHLLEMWAMRDLVPVSRRAWCTLDGPDVRSLLDGERVTLAHGPTCRTLRNLARNLVVAWRVLRRHRPRVVLCTGSGIVVPFAWVGRLLGARVLYVECGGRVDEPSLSCRIVSRVAHRTYLQWPELVPQVPGGQFHGRLPWERSTGAAARNRSENRTLITVGTSRVFAFDRLVGSSDLIDGPGSIVVQRGNSTIAPRRASVLVDFMSFNELCDEMAAADAVVTHAGIGSVLLAMMHGHRPIVMPRRTDLGESVDDHQMMFARQLEREGLATVVEGPADLPAVLRRLRHQDPPVARRHTGNALLRRLEVDFRDALVGA
jgi:UDP-N-acetylglucosamine--N-acetylmuramyl-(pentapeptide) pyrophosphoryl-undecaprenol N-acetylglucosamine transferase